MFEPNKVPYVVVFPEEEEMMDALIVRTQREIEKWGLPRDEYLLVEIHCAKKNCRCCQVMFNLVSLKQGQIMATLLGEWEPRALKISVQLDPYYLQSAYAPMLLKRAEVQFFSKPKYIRQLKEHARQVKEKTALDLLALPMQKTVPPIDELELLELKITLQDTGVWRRFQVPANIDLETLHTFLQSLMGWQNYHLWQFSDAKQKKRYGVAYDESALWGVELEVASEVNLGHLLKRKGSKLFYEYDFGDCWQHEIVLEKRFKVATRKERIMQCLDGAMACPPEDCGGVGGYEDILAAFKHPQKVTPNLKAWLEDFEPEKFDLKALNKQIRSLLL